MDFTTDDVIHDLLGKFTFKYPNISIVRQLLIWGKGGHSKVIASCFNMVDNISIEFIDSSEEHKLKDMPPDKWEIFVAIGDNAARERIVKHVRGLGYTTPNVYGGIIIHSTSECVPKNSNIYLGHYVLIGPNSIIGDNVILNSGTIVDHDCVVGAHSHLAPRTTLCGNVTIGERCFIGPGTTVCMKTTIASSCIVGAGSTVLKDLYIPRGKYWGTPAELHGMQLHQDEIDPTHPPDPPYPLED